MWQPVTTRTCTLAQYATATLGNIDQRDKSLGYAFVGHWLLFLAVFLGTTRLPRQKFLVAAK